MLRWIDPGGPGGRPVGGGDGCGPVLADADGTLRAGPKSFPVVPTGPAPLAVVKERAQYDFGTMAQLSRGSKAWTIRNEGEADLQDVRSRARPASAPSPTSAPTARRRSSRARRRRSAWSGRPRSCRASSPSRPRSPPTTRRTRRFVFRVVGPRPAAHRDGAARAGRLSDERPERRRGRSPTRRSSPRIGPDFKITAITSSRPDLVEGTIKPLDASRPQGPGDRAGHHMEIKVKPTTALGPFSEELVWRPTTPSRPEVEDRVWASWSAPINPTPEEVRLLGRLGPGRRRHLDRPLVRGQDAHEVRGREKAGPLKVEIAPVDQTPQGDGRGHGRRARPAPVSHDRDRPPRHRARRDRRRRSCSRPTIPTPSA